MFIFSEILRSLTTILQIAEYSLSLRKCDENKHELTKFLSEVFRRCSRIEILRLCDLDIGILRDSLGSVVIKELVLLDHSSFESGVE